MPADLSCLRFWPPGIGFAANTRARRARLPGIAWRQWNFLESLDVMPLVEDVDAVIHLAAAVSNAQLMERVNVAATRALAQAASRAGVAYFGHASSIVVYGSPLYRNIDEATPLLDPSKPMASQYYAEPYMLEYARTKTLAELALQEMALPLAIDLMRPAVVADLDRMLEVGGWSMPRRIMALYRRTQYIYAGDAAAAVVHLLARGINAKAPGVEAFNICDERCGTFGALLERARTATQDAAFRAPPFELPVLPDMAKDLVRYRNLPIRYPLGMLRLSNAKLRGTGFRFPIGFDRAVGMAIDRRLGRAVTNRQPNLAGAV